MEQKIYGKVKKSVLIYMPENKIKPVGGPRGYVYNLKSFFEEYKINNVSFLPSETFHKNMMVSAYSGKRGWIKENILKPLRNFICYGMPILKSDRDENIEENKYEQIHFHTTLEMYRRRKSLRKYKGTVILTSHCPMVLHKEIWSMLSTAEKFIFGFVYKKLSRIDEYAFNRADYITFPCVEAEEPYEHSWKNYSEIKHRNALKYRYILTGINKCSVKITKNQFRKKWGIPQDAFVFCYVGRHNDVKGYRRLKVFGKTILERNSDIYFLIAGKEEPLKGIDNSRWIEVGWTDDPHSVIGASDVFILPNKETYFDLILLEVLSLGKPILASYTGGNKYFSSDEGIKLFKSDEDFYKKIQTFLAMPQEELESMGNANERLFDKKFTRELFGENYINLMNNLD